MGIPHNNDAHMSQEDLDILDSATLGRASSDGSEDGMLSSEKAQEVETPPMTIRERLASLAKDSPLAWSQVLVSFLLVVNGFGYFSSFGLFEAHWEKTLGRHASEISWVGSTQLFLLFFVGTLSGRLMDVGYFRSLLIAGCVFQIVGIFLSSAVTEYWQLFLTQGILQGIGDGILFTPLVTLVSLYFDANRPIALGVAACGAPVGGVVFTTIARQLESELSYAWIIRIMGAVVVVNTAIILWLAKTKPLQRPAAPWFDTESWKDPVYTLFAIGIFFVCWGVYFAYFYTTTFGIESIGLTSSDSLLLLKILNGVGIPGRLVPALLANVYFGSFNVLIPATFGAAIMLLVWTTVANIGGYMAFVVCYGICANAVQTLFPSALADLTSDPTKMGVRIGMVFTVVSVACLTGPPIAGALITLNNGVYTYAQLFGGLSVLAGAIFLIAARWVQRKPAGYSKVNL